MRITIPHSKPTIGDEEVTAVSNVIRTGHVAQGPETQALERDVAQFVGKPHAVAVSSGTAALYLALRGLDVRPGGSVVLPSYACTALNNAVTLCGAQPILADVDPQSGLLTPDTVRGVIDDSTKAVIVPHLFGAPADASGIESLGIPVIEDCAQCVGATFDGNAVGSLSTVSMFSFYATKVLCAGEGGMLISSDAELIDCARDLRDYDMKQQLRPRFNLKMTDMQAAMARQQLRKLGVMNERRRQIAELYRESFAPHGEVIALPPLDPRSTPMYFRFVIGLKPPFRRDDLMAFMERRGIACAKPVYEPLHRYLQLDGFSGTERMFQGAISIPCYPTLESSQCEAVIEGILSFIGVRA